MDANPATPKPFTKPPEGMTTTTAKTPYVPQRGETLRLHIGGEVVKDGWKIVNIQYMEGVVDFLGSATDLSAFADETVEEVYASHIYEHLDYKDELAQAMSEAFRVLKPGGILRAGVPDLDVLCRLMIDTRLDVEAKFYIQRMMFGGHVDDFDYHYVGLTMDIFGNYLWAAGFRNIRRVPEFGLFEDATNIKFMGVPISLNVVAMKPVSKE